MEKRRQLDTFGTAVEQTCFVGSLANVSSHADVADVAQLVRALDCGSGGRGFKSHHSPHIEKQGSLEGVFCYAIHMRQQKKIWLEEHSKGSTLPTMANELAASGVITFAEWLKEHGITSGKAVDIGSGKGRNSIHFAKLGFTVTGLEYIEPAIVHAEAMTKQANVSDGVTFLNTEIDAPWPFDDNYFDVAVDSFSSIDIETKAGRQKYRDEMLRTLKPGGFALVSVCSADDEWERELIATHPGSEPNSTIWPQNGKFQKDYTEAELREFYKPFTVVELRTINKPAHKLGRDGTATNFWVVLQKPTSGEVKA